MTTMEERPDDDLVTETESDLERAESADDEERLETLEKVRERLESELDDRDETPPS